MNNKGFLYTLGLSLFLLALLTLGILFLRQSALEQNRNIESGFSLKAWDEYTSINKAVADVFINTGIFLNSTNKTATFGEPLPHNFTAFDQFMQVFIDRVEGNFTDVNISLDKFYAQHHEVCFRPIGIAYQHQGSCPTCDKLDDRLEIDKNDNITSFNITFKFNYHVTCSEPSPHTSGPKLNIKINIIPADVSCDIYAIPTFYNGLILDFTNDTGSKANLEIKTGGSGGNGCFGATGGVKMLTLKTKDPTTPGWVPIDSTIIVGYLNSPPEKGYFETGIELTINQTAFNLYKKNNIIFPLPRQS